MTFEQWKAATAEVNARAARIEHMRSVRARNAFEAAFGGKSNSFECFLYAHNWGDQSWLTPEQRKACRFVRYMDDKRWEASRIAERIVSRMWKQHCASRGYGGQYVTFDRGSRKVIR